jgi:broad specificity phosphatase PhoE
LNECRIILLRHAETSAPDRFHGAESDVGLGARGLLQAEAVARRLAARAPDVLYSSAMLRARQTADAIARACGLTPQVIPELHERKMGPLSGLSREEGLGAYAEAKRRWMAGEVDYTHEGGESYAAIRARVVPIFRRLAEGAAGKTAVVVAHGVVIRVALTSLLAGSGPEDFERFAIDNAALNELRWDGRAWAAEALNQRVYSDPGGDGWVW